MDGTRLQAKLFAGYGKAAKRIGRPHIVYRPQPGVYTDPIVPGNIVSTIPAVFALHKEQFGFGMPGDYKNNLYHVLFDATGLLPGDYLIGPDPGTWLDGTYYITNFDPIKPILCVQCTLNFTLYRSQQQSGVGLGSYGGEVMARETMLFSDWPGGVDLRSQADRNASMLPADTAGGSYEILLPKIGTVIPRPSDIFVDENARRYAVKTCEISELGWRIRVNELVT